MGFFFDHLFVLALCFVPFPLHFEGFGVELVRRKGLGGIAAEVLRGAGRKIGVRVDKNEENFGILGELMAEQTKKIQRGVATVNRQGAAQPKNTCLFPDFRGTLTV